MIKEAVVSRKKILLVGGMDYNVPQELKDAFEIVKHITQGSKYQTLPAVDYVLVITEWANHNLVESVKKSADAEIIFLPRGGWPGMRGELERRSILAPETSLQEAAVEVHKVSAESLLSSMTESDIWKKYGQKLIEAAQVTLKPKEIIKEDVLLEALSLSGVPKGDCAIFIPRLQMKGILDPCNDGKWRLMSAPGVDFDNDRVSIPSEVEAASTGAALGVTGKRRSLKSSSVVNFIAALDRGPYTSKRAIYEEMRKYKEFDALSDHQVKGYVERAIVLKIIDDSNKNLFIKQQSETVLTRKDIKEPDPLPEKVVLPVRLPSFTDVQKPTAKEMDKLAAEKSWCHVVENVRKDRERVANVISHCRIEWMGVNNVLCIFLPAVLSQWMKFLESTENWGLISRAVQERFAKDTAIRFILDNGLRS